MKFSMKYVVAIAILVITLISGYQAYWLINIYNSLDAKLQKDLKEAVRAADFEEIVFRVRKMQDENFGGKMDITVGADPTHETTTLKNESKKTLDAEETETNLDTDLPSGGFEDALKDADDVMNVGLSMQSGIHSGLDNLRAPDFNLYDQLLTKRLDSLGVSVPHQSLYLRHSKYEGKQFCDTLARLGSITADVDTFRLDIDINAKTEYVVFVPRRNYAVMKQMQAPLVFSGFTLLILLLAFAYIINIIKKMKQLDEMKSDFTNNITHELKTPIAVAYAANDALLNFDAKSNPEKLKKYLSIEQEQLTILSELVEQILSLSMERRRSMKLDITDVSVSEVVLKIVDNQRLKTKKSLVIDVDVPDDITVQVDRMHFSNIINNLVDNAIKYSAEAVHIIITCQNDKEGHTVITVKDNGIGISSDQQRYIFDKFYRVPHGNLYSVKGYGLGLYYVKNMMERFGGNVAINSELGKGSTFKLTFNG